MIAALLLGRKGSVGFPGKNLFPVLGRPLLQYPLMAALNTPAVDRVYISTDDERIMEVGRKHGAEIIVRPPELATKAALGEDAYAHGYREICKQVHPEKLELVVLLFCNAATITARTIQQGIEALRRDPKADSAVTVSAYNMWSPIRARKENAKGYLDPFVPFSVFGDEATINCDRDAMGEVLFADMSASVVRPHCLDRLRDGLLPQKWMGRHILPIKQWGGLDVDYEWQIPQVEFWLTKNGFTKERTPYDK